MSVSPPPTSNAMRVWDRRKKHPHQLLSRSVRWRIEQNQEQNTEAKIRNGSDPDQPRALSRLWTFVMNRKSAPGPAPHTPS